MQAVEAADQPLTFHDPAGHSVSAVLATPAAPTERIVLLCHGFLSNKNSSTNKALTRLLSEQGIATFRFDFFGQGDSEGPFERITLTMALDQALAAWDQIRARGYRRIGLMGSSFGGLVAILVASLAAERGHALAALGLKCPVLDFPETLRMEFGESGMERWKQGQEIPDVTGRATSIRLRYNLYENCLTYDAYKAAERIQVPTLIVQGDRDELIPQHQSQRLYDALAGPKRLDIVSGADHGFTTASDFHTMVGSLSGWFAQHL